MFDLEFMPPSAVDLIKKEIQLLAALDHPNIVRCLGHSLTDTSTTLYMELFAQSLRDLLSDPTSSLPRGAAATLGHFGQITEGVAYLHDEGVLHRDLKSENVYVHREASGVHILKIGDMGEAKDIAARSRILRPGQKPAIVGTPEFLAPEVFAAVPLYSRASDVWALGMTLFELITSEIPYHLDGIEPFALSDSIRGGVKPSFPASVGQSFEPVIKIFSRCTAASPAARPTAAKLVVKAQRAQRKIVATLGEPSSPDDRQPT
uniref:Protein kinase domain-containing protein n=1 Tax=Sexangularia sp. CB-2014 TaxID=1486929 RepID=A0A7S1VBV0_9EUKA